LPKVGAEQVLDELDPSFRKRQHSAPPGQRSWRSSDILPRLRHPRCGHIRALKTFNELPCSDIGGIGTCVFRCWLD
jgi:hypothetical protein